MFDNLIAPPNRSMRWSDPGYDSPPEDQFALVGHPIVNDRLGFVFHEACWALLEEALRPAPVPLPRMYAVNRSLPLPYESACHSWGHDYAGLVIVDDENYFPWEDRFQDLRNYTDPHPVFSRNPYRVAEVDDILGRAPEEPPAPVKLQNSHPTSEAMRDCFAALPAEICAAIAMYLPVADMLRARLASRAFWPIFHDQQFWAAQFKQSGERSWLFEARRDALPRDWRSLYRQTSDARIGPGLRNRQRVWRLIQGVVDILDLSWTDLETARTPDAIHCIEATADLTDRLVVASRVEALQAAFDASTADYS
ncbi:1c2a8415-dfe9-42a5-b2b2-c766cd78b923 [Thermothielavioides terrestris]|uniref:1c2a8415-dfe9-42a5-b2b2-c766cd78b923 n=1 Tax=Thermothielavioides terrestris TaxID=2587410 RepID=A0A446B5B6_9PEZI|nr:1c2a8415-dfe9-42a5-b2b2-c766cd78b923 [Thermothielavioides terrestris]